MLLTEHVVLSYNQRLQHRKQDKAPITDAGGLCQVAAIGLGGVIRLLITQALGAPDDSHL